MRAHTVSKGFGIVAVIFSLLFFIVPFLPAWLHAGEINASPISISPTDFIRGENTIDCGGNGLRIEAVSVAIDAEPSIIYRGTTSTLSWTSTGAKSAEIDQGIGIVDLHGTLEVSPSKTTTYTITIHWCKGMTTTDSVTIEVLTPEPKPEPTPAPLIITYTVPSDTKLNVAIDSAITAHFSMAINGSTATTNNFKLRDGESDISGSVSSNGTTITFTPSTNLAYDTTYTAIITDGITAANNAGTQLDSEYTWTFTTEKEPPLLEVTIRADPERIILSPGGTNPDNSMPKTIAKRETVTLAWTSANANTENRSGMAVSA
ncbi:MAG: Ig-like domain-containing protein [Candidatus Brocadiaceae bacterium]|nr:Ig-like domain-containing protein [Candidatus Brocadiaceae bacterium]